MIAGRIVYPYRIAEISVRCKCAIDVGFGIVSLESALPT